MHRDVTSWPFVGRRAELEQLVGFMTTGSQRGAVVVGRAGMGKSSLLARGLDAARAAGMAVASAKATNALRDLPFGALASILPADIDIPTHDLSSLLRVYAASLARMAGGRRLVLAVDDAHLLDDASAVLVDQVARRGDVTVVVTVRAGHRVPETITALWKDHWLDRLELGELDPAAVHEMLVDVLAGPVDPIVAERIVQRCRGNPMFVRELITAALSEGRFRDGPGGWRLDGWPRASDRLIDLVRAALAGLTDDEERLLELLAFAEPLGPAELDTFGLQRTVERLERNGVVTSCLSGKRLEVRLAHPVIGDVIGSRMTPRRRHGIASARADALERTGLRRREDTLVVASWRLEAGGGNADLLVAGAAAALRRHHYRLTEQLASAAVDRGAGFAARFLVAEAASLVGRPDEAEAKFAALAPLAETDEERAQVATARMGAALRTGRARLEILEEAESTIKDQHWRDHVLAMRGALIAVTGGFRTSLDTLAPLIARADPIPGAAYTIGIHDLNQLGRLEDAHALLARAKSALGASTTTGAFAPELLHREVELLTWSGELLAAESVALGAQRAAADHDGTLDAYASSGLATCRLEQGRVRSAAATAARAFQLLRDSGRPAPARPPGWTAAIAYAIAGDVDAANRMLAEVESLPGTTVLAPPRRREVEAWFQVATGATEDARRGLSEAASAMIDLGDDQHASHALHAVGRLGDPEAAHDRLRQLVGGMDGALAQARLDHVEALCARDPEALEGVARAFEAMGANLYAAEADAAAARQLRDRGRDRAAIFATRRAAALAAQCEAEPISAGEDLLRAPTLTPAEVATAELAAAGRSNRSIADELLVSVRTVENRLQRIYEKLGVSGRDELVDALPGSPDA